MASAFDPRIVQVTIDFEDGAQTYEGLSIYASGRKFLGTLMNQGEFRIFNLTKEQRNYILSRTSPLNLQRAPVKMALNVGRQSYGTFRLFDGYVKSSSATQPPDIAITLIALTNSLRTNLVLFHGQSSLTQLRVIAQQIADSNSVILNFQATDKQIENYCYSGCAAYQVEDLNRMGGIIAHIDNGTLTVLDAGTVSKNPLRIISAATGMIGIPQFTDTGIIVKVMIDNTIELGNLIRIESEALPAANGGYKIMKILFEVASRDQQFYYTLDCIALNYYYGTL